MHVCTPQIYPKDLIKFRLKTSFKRSMFILFQVCIKIDAYESSKNILKDSHFVIFFDLRSLIKCVSSFFLYFKLINAICRRDQN